MEFWSQNIGIAGRVARIVPGILMLAAALLLHRAGVEKAAWLTGCGCAFVMFDGLRGRCAVRACKLKTLL